jgi:hypothetical protein
LMYMFQREQVFSKTDVANFLSNKTIIWTKQQKGLLESNPKRVLFTSDFGTGKTTLIKAKAKQLGKERHLQYLKEKFWKTESSSGKIFFVVFTGQDALLTQSLKSELEDPKHHVQVLSLAGELISVALFISYLKTFPSKLALFLI